MEGINITIGQEVLAKLKDGRKMFVHRSGENYYVARENKYYEWKNIKWEDVEEYWTLPPGITSFNCTNLVFENALKATPVYPKEENKPIKLYVAASLTEYKRPFMYTAVEKLRALGYNVYAPIEHVIENAWDWPNTEWGLQVFRNDVNAIKDSDFVIVLTWGRLDTSSGTTWEQGFAYGIGKKVILVEMDDSVQSLMVANGRFATVKGIDGLCGYDFNDPKPLRTETEQK